MTPIDLTSLMNCTYGSAGFRIEEFKHSEKPITRDGYGRIGTEVSLDIDGWIDGANYTDYINKLVACVNAFRVDGQLFQITGPTGTPIISFLPAAAIGGGPFVDFHHEKGSAPLTRKIKLKIFAPVNNVQANTPGAAASNNYIAHVATAADGRQTIVWSGTIHGVSSGTVFQQFLSTFQGIYALPDYVVTYENESSTEANQGRTTYKLNAEKLAVPLPSSGANFAVDGEITQNFEIDEQGKKTFVTGANCLIKGDPTAFHQFLRGQINQSDYPIFRESFAVSTTRGLRVTSRFTQLMDAEADGLVEFQQQITIAKDMECWEEKTFVGADPIAVKRPKTLGLITQRGRAVALGQYMKPPDPIAQWPTRVNEPDFTQLSAEEYETAWSYEMFATDPSTMTDQTIDPYSISRPTEPEFE